MKVDYVDPLTGAVLDQWQEGCLEIKITPEEEERQPDREWLPDYFMEQMLKIKARREVIKAQYKKRLAALDTEERSLYWDKGARFERVVLQEITGAKKKSVEYEYGRAGFRKARQKVIVNDEKAALAWAEEHCPAAVKIVPEQRSLLKGSLPKHADVPGIERVNPEPEFYYRFAKAEA